MLCFLQEASVLDILWVIVISRQVAALLRDSWKWKHPEQIHTYNDKPFIWEFYILKLRHLTLECLKMFQYIRFGFCGVFWWETKSQLVRWVGYFVLIIVLTCCEKNLKVFCTYWLHNQSTEYVVNQYCIHM